MTAHVVDPMVRQTLGVHLGVPLTQAVAEFDAYLGHSVNPLEWTDHPLIHGRATFQKVVRSLTAVTLATHLERHGLRWAALDPGVRELAYWRRTLAAYRGRRPRVVALSTSFVMSGPWLRSLCALVRRLHPTSMLAVGGCFYLTNVREFLSLDADVYCIGEGEQRLPQMVRAVGAGEPIEAIPGLYLRDGDGRLKATGAAAPLPLDALEGPDWRLAERIEPPLEVADGSSYYSVETQRGCLYQCEFCTYRTLTCHAVLSAGNAVAAIRSTALLPPGHLFLIDATATSPKKRWQDLLHRLKTAGGPPHPMIVFSRVSDLTEPAVAAMAGAGVIGVVVGQESGDQRLLDAMKKGTRVDQVPRAVAALEQHGIGAQFCFIHGFPGESAESIRATRAMIAALNRGGEAEPVVTAYNLMPFSAFDFAAVTHRQTPHGVEHFLGYRDAEFNPQRVAEEMLATLIAVSPVRGSPLCAVLFNGRADHLYTIRDRTERTAVYRWMKAYERGVALFVERNLEGTAPDGTELKRLGEEVRAHLPRWGRFRSGWARIVCRARARQCQRMGREWLAEATRGPGPITRSVAAFRAGWDLGRLRDAVAGWRAATYPEAERRAPHDPATVEQFADELLRRALE